MINTPPTLSWRGLVFRGDGVPPWFLDKLIGFGDLPGASFENVQATDGHGRLATPGVQEANTIQAEGFIFSEVGKFSQDENTLVRLFKDQLIPLAADDDTLEPLQVTMAGVTRTAMVSLVIGKPYYTSESMGSGAIPWTIQWRQPDPRVFGDWMVSAATPLITNPAGVNLPQVQPFLMPAKPIGGQVTVDNPGNDPEGSPAILTLTGAQSGAVGVTNTRSGAIVQFDFALGVDDILVIDTELGTSYLNGQVRAPARTSSVIRSLRALAGANVYRATGTGGAGTPTITAAVHPRFWS